MPISPPNYSTLSAMITPAIFLTANGSLILSTSNRMSRVVDRIRVLVELGDRLCRDPASLDFPGERVAHLQDQLDRLVWRSDRVRIALTLLYLSFGAFVCTSLALALDIAFGYRLSFVPTLTAVFGVVLMLGACINLVREALEALRSNRLEVKFFRELHRKRSGAELSSAPAESIISSQANRPA